MGALMSSCRASLSSLANNLDLSNVGNGTAALENPGTMNELHENIQEVMPANFEGGMVTVNKDIGNLLKIYETVKFRRSLMAPTGFQLGAVYIGSKQISPTAAFPILLSNIDESGSGNAVLVHQITSRFRVNTAAQVQRWGLSAAEATIEERGPSNSIGMAVGSLPGVDLIMVNYLQSVTRELALGAQIACQFSKIVPGGQLAMVMAAGRYSNKDMDVTVTVGQSKIILSCCSQVSKNFQYTLQTSLGVLQSVAVIGCKVHLPEAGVIFKGMVNTNCDMGILLQQSFKTLPFSIVLSMNRLEKEFRFGFGIIID